MYIMVILNIQILSVRGQSLLTYTDNESMGGII